MGLGREPTLCVYSLRLLWDLCVCVCVCVCFRRFNWSLCACNGIAHIKSHPHTQSGKFKTFVFFELGLSSKSRMTNCKKNIGVDENISLIPCPHGLTWGSTILFLTNVKSNHGEVIQLMEQQCYPSAAQRRQYYCNIMSLGARVKYTFGALDSATQT